MNVERTLKNWALATVCALFFALVFFRGVRMPEPLSLGMLTWLAAALAMVLINLRPLRAFVVASVRHAGLFLLTGAALGMTLGRAIRQPDSLTTPEWAWLALAVVGVAIHYSPSERDPYVN